MTLTWLTEADFSYFWLGPLGRLRQLPLLPLAGATDADEDVVGDLHVSLAGAATQDVMGHKRSWRMDWAALSPTETAPLHAWYLGLSRSPLRIVDPRAGNRLTRDGSSGGSYSRSAAAHTVTAGTRAYAAVTDYPTAYAGLVDGGVAWSVPLSTVCTLRVDDTDRIPLIPGQAITVRALVKGTLGAQLGVQYYDVAGVAGSTSLASSVTLAGWAELSHTFTPSALQVSASAVLTVASGAARTVTVGPAWWHPTETSWSPGHGCPRVLATGMGTRHPGLALSQPSLTLREA